MMVVGRFLFAGFLLLISASFSGADELKLENLMREKLESASRLEVVVSKVHIPPSTTLPRHWHPGEEFVYVLEGTVTLWQKGKANVSAKEGDALKVPLKQIHTALTGDEGVTLLVFRVHEEGKPERIGAE